MIIDIKCNAPKGATHYKLLAMIERVMYFKKINGIIYWFDDCDRWVSVAELDGIDYMKKLRKTIRPIQGIF